jgi:hypothetical protein
VAAFLVSVVSPEGREETHHVEAGDATDAATPFDDTGYHVRRVVGLRWVRQAVRAYLLGGCRCERCWRGVGT